MSLTTGILGTLPFYPALLPDAADINSFTAGGNATTVFDYEGLAGANVIARLRNLQTANNQKVALTVTADSYTANAIDAAAVNMAQSTYNAWGRTFGETAIQNRLLMTALNNSAGTITDQWFSWGVQVERPNIAQMQQFAADFSLTAEQQALAEKYASGSRGVLPRSLDWIIANEYATQITGGGVLGQTLNLTTSMQTAWQESVGPNEALVLVGLAVTPGTYANNITLQVGIDNTANVYQITSFGLGSGAIQPCFLQAKQQIVIAANAGANVSNITVTPVIWHVRLTDEIRAHMGMPVKDPNTLAKVLVGVL